MHTIILVYPEQSQINRLKLAGLLDERGRPVRMTHVTTSELSDAESRALSIYENVMLSPLHASRNNLVIIFDRDGRAFECNKLDISEMEHAEQHPTAV